jgi:hypothetical protein
LQSIDHLPGLKLKEEKKSKQEITAPFPFSARSKKDDHEKQLGNYNYRKNIYKGYGHKKKYNSVKHFFKDKKVM